MRLSNDKINHITHLILNGLIEKDTIELIYEEGKVRREIRRVIVDDLRLDEEIDAFVRSKLQSYSRRIFEGSPEWEVMYQKFFHEEMAKRKRI
ncbi:MAG: DUF507 family protein [Nitrospirota bacterium]